jgi:acyl-CoA synthetase (AMP-forming)/AMP-acid ligase II
MDRAALVELKERVTELPGRLRIVTRVAQQSGMLWTMTWPGLKAAAAALGGGANNPSQVYRILAANHPEKVGLYWHDEALTFGEIDAQMDRVAANLQRRGLGRGGSMLVMMRNRPEFVLTCAGTGRLGAAAVSVSWRSTSQELSYLATHCGAKAICFEHDLWPVVEETLRTVPAIGANLFIVGLPQGKEPPKARGSGGYPPGQCVRFEELLAEGGALVAEKGAEDDAAVVIYTSGTTGKPKGAVRKFPRDAMPAAMQLIAELPMRVDDIHLVPCPLYHSTAFGFLAFSHILGASAVLMDEFKAEPFLQAVDRFGVTTTALVPTMLHRVLGLGPEVLGRYHTRSLRAIFSMGAPLPAPLALEAMDRFGDVLYNLYGATEFGIVTLATPKDLREAPGTIGRKIPGTEIRLLDDAGLEVETGAVGELWAKSKLVVEGYHNDRAATEASLKEGFFSVGDLARKDASGRYFIEGRKRDMVISGGVNVYPAEIEAVLEAHPDVAEVAVVGAEDPDLGERVRAFVVKKHGSGVDEGTLKTWSRERLSGAKVPRDFVFVDALPRNPTGKVLKRELRAWAVPRA